METIRVAAAVIREGNRVYATARGYGDYQGQWEFPGGKVEEGETSAEALRREITEELGAEVEVGDLISTVEYDYPDFHLSMDCFFCTVLRGELKPLEAADARWLTVEELYDVSWLPADRIVVPEVERVMKADAALYEAFLKERKEIGAGMKAKVYEFRGFAYKCFQESYPSEWIDYEIRQQHEVVKSGLPIPWYYRSTFPKTIKMDLLKADSYVETANSADMEKVITEFLSWFHRIHEVRGLSLPSLAPYLRAEIDRANVTDERKALAVRFLEEIENTLPEEEVLCHMDYHFLNLMKQGDQIYFIDWVDAKNGKAIWDYARSYVIIYEHAAGFKNRYIKYVLNDRNYTTAMFYKAVYVNTLHRLNVVDSPKVRELLEFSLAMIRKEEN